MKNNFTAIEAKLRFLATESNSCSDSCIINYMGFFALLLYRYLFRLVDKLLRCYIVGPGFDTGPWLPPQLVTAKRKRILCNFISARK